MTQRYLWLLDAGHAPSTPGKRSPEFDDGYVLREYELTRDVVDRIAVRMEGAGYAYHLLTPRTDADMPARTRASLANRIAKWSGLPCRLVSVHANAFGRGVRWRDANGTVTLHSGRSAASLAMAQTFQARMVQRLQRRDRGVKAYPKFAVLRRTSMPAVITEAAFYTYREEAKLLRTDTMRAAIAGAHVEAIGEIERGEVEA